MLNNKERLNLIRNLGVMLGAGIPILKAVDSLEKESKGNEKKILNKLHEDLNQGKKLSESFKNHKKAFDPITINLIGAAEESGNLDETLKDLSEQIKKDIEFSEKIKSALMYPAFIFILFIVIFLVILTYVIPRISQVFEKLNVILPLPTRILIVTSEFFLSYYPYIIIVTILLIILGVFIYTTKKRELVSFLYSLPLLSKLAMQIDITRVTKSMGLLLSSGIPINKALDLSTQVAARKPMVKALNSANKRVEEGKHLSETLEKHPKAFTQLALRFIEAGEQSGTLEQSMTQLSLQYEEEVTNTLKRITTLMEPVMLVVIGLFVGGIMLSIIAPIYQLIGNITTR